MCLISVDLVEKEEGDGADTAFLFLPGLFVEEEEREKDSIEEKDEFQGSKKCRREGTKEEVEGKKKSKVKEREEKLGNTARRRSKLNKNRDTKINLIR